MIPEETECPTCGRDDFKSGKGMKRHHLYAHGESIAGHPRECAYCGEITRVNRHQYENNENVFCSGDSEEFSPCRRKWLSENNRGEDHPSWVERHTITCEWCDGTFEATEFQIERGRRFCPGEGCKYEWLAEQFSGKGGPGYAGKTLSLTCDYCDGPYEAYASDDRRFCGRPCYEAWYSETLFGPNHHSWTGRFGGEVRERVVAAMGSRSWRDSAITARNSTGNTCYMCGSSESGESLSVHHIVPTLNGGTNGQWNLTPLCRSCHRTAENYIMNHIPELASNHLVPERERNKALPTD